MGDHNQPERAGGGNRLDRYDDLSETDGDVPETHGDNAETDLHNEATTDVPAADDAASDHATTHDETTHHTTSLTSDDHHPASADPACHGSGDDGTDRRRSGAGSWRGIGPGPTTPARRGLTSLKSRPIGPGDTQPRALPPLEPFRRS
jgi:hypothetical protein